MLSVTATSSAIACILLLSNLVLAAPTVQMAKRIDILNCTRSVLNFDELGSSDGRARTLPCHKESNGLCTYHDLQFYGVGWVSNGIQKTKGGSLDGQGTFDMTSHSQKNALVTQSDGGYFLLRPGPAREIRRKPYYQYLEFDLFSMWVRPEFEGAWTLSVDCENAQNGAKEYNATYSIPALPSGVYHKIKFDSRFVDLGQCYFTPDTDQQFLIDDIDVNVCLYEL